MKLTIDTVKNLSYNKEPSIKPDGSMSYPRCVFWDDQLPGFGLRIYQTNKKVFIINYRINGRSRQMTIGKLGVLTVDEARKRAKAKLVEVLNGKDPLAERQKVEQGETVKDLAEAYLERYAKEHKKSWKNDDYRLQKYILPRWGKRKASDIAHDDVAKLHTDLKEKPYLANRIVELISVMYSKGRRWGFVPKDFENPASDIDHYKEAKRDRWITPEELPRFAQAINEETDPYARAALWLYLLTGLRKTELLSARWDNIDFERREWRIPDTKSERVLYLPMSEPVIATLKQLPWIEGNPHVFPGKAAGSHRTDFKKAWTRVREKAGITDVRLHDLRRTLGSWMAQAGNSLHLIGRVLNHSNQSTTAVYARFAQDTVRDALESHAQQVIGVAGQAEAGEVVPIKGTK